MAITCVAGNGPLELVTRNTLATLEAGGLATVPVYAGLSQHLHTHTYFRHPDQVRSLNLPEPTITPANTHAIDFLIDYYLSSAGPETILVPVAPLTNIATALLREPKLAQRIPRMVMMGGAYTQGNSTPSAEFNIYADPEAARLVFQAGIPLSMIGLEVTQQALLTEADATQVLANHSPGAQVAGAIIQEEISWWHARDMTEPAGQVYDACAVVAVIEPDILQTQPAHCAIELIGELTRGRTVCDFNYARRGTTANVEVGVGLDRDRFRAIVLEAFGHLGTSGHSSF